MADPYNYEISMIHTIPGDTYARLEAGKKIIGVVKYNALLNRYYFADKFIKIDEKVFSKKMPIPAENSIKDQVYRYHGKLGKIRNAGGRLVYYDFIPLDHSPVLHPHYSSPLFKDDQYPFPTIFDGDPIPEEFKDICLESIHYHTVLEFLKMEGRDYYTRPKNMIFVYNKGLGKKGMGEIFNPTLEKLPGSRFVYNMLYMLNGEPTPFEALSFCKLNFIPDKARDGNASAAGGAGGSAGSAGGASASSASSAPAAAAAPVVAAGGAGAGSAGSAGGASSAGSAPQTTNLDDYTMRIDTGHAIEDRWYKYNTGGRYVLGQFLITFNPKSGYQNHLIVGDQDIVLIDDAELYTVPLFPGEDLTTYNVLYGGGEAILGKKYKFLYKWGYVVGRVDWISNVPMDDGTPSYVKLTIGLDAKSIFIANNATLFGFNNSVQLPAAMGINNRPAPRQAPPRGSCGNHCTIVGGSRRSKKSRTRKQKKQKRRSTRKI